MLCPIRAKSVGQKLPTIVYKSAKKGPQRLTFFCGVNDMCLPFACLLFICEQRNQKFHRARKRDQMRDKRLPIHMLSLFLWTIWGHKTLGQERLWREKTKGIKNTKHWKTLHKNHFESLPNLTQKSSKLHFPLFQLLTYKVSSCPEKADCNSCVAAKDPLCGFCLSEGRCMPQIECSAGLVRQCPLRLGSIEPANVSMSQLEATVFVPLGGLPEPEAQKVSVLGNDIYFV